MAADTQHPNNVNPSKDKFKPRKQVPSVHVEDPVDVEEDSEESTDSPVEAVQSSQWQSIVFVRFYEFVSFRMGGSSRWESKKEGKSSSRR